MGRSRSGFRRGEHLMVRSKAPSPANRAPVSGRLRRGLSRALYLTAIMSLLAVGVSVSSAAAAGQPLSTIGIIGKCCHEGVLGEYYYANSLDINKKTGDLYLLDPNNSHVLVFDQNGNYK